MANEQGKAQSRIVLFLEEDAVSMIVHGFCKEVFAQLPMEFAVEAKELLNLTLEGSVG